MKQRTVRTYELGDEEIRNAIEAYVMKHADAAFAGGQLVAVRHESLSKGDVFSYGLSAIVEVVEVDEQ